MKMMRSAGKPAGKTRIGFTFDWMKKWREFFKLIVQRTQLMQNQLHFDTRMNTALLSHDTLLLNNTDIKTHHQFPLEHHRNFDQMKSHLKRPDKSRGKITGAYRPFLHQEKKTFAETIIQRALRVQGSQGFDTLFSAGLRANSLGSSQSRQSRLVAEGRRACQHVSIPIPTLKAVRRVCSRRLLQCQELVVPIQMQAVWKERNVHYNNNHYSSLVQQAFAAFLPLVHSTKVKMILVEKCRTLAIYSQEMLINQI